MSIGRHYSASSRSRDIYHDVKVGGGNLKAGMPNTTDMTITESYRVLYRIKKRKTRRAYNFVPYPFPRRRNSAGVGMDVRFTRHYFKIRSNNGTPGHVYRPIWNGRQVETGDTVLMYTSPTYEDPTKMADGKTLVYLYKGIPSQ